MMPPIPTRTRFKVVALAILLAMVTYVDRACIGKMAGQISASLALSKIQMGYVFTAFALAYSLFEIPTAWLADRGGVRRVLTRIVLWWSAFTMLTGAAWSYGSMLAVRFLFGAGEAGAWPCVGRTFSRWIPQRERGRVQGFFFAGAHLAGGVTPLVVGLMLQVMSWRVVFMGCGVLGLAWAGLWHRWFRDEPAEHPAVNSAEREYIEETRATAASHSLAGGYWRTLLGHRNTWVLCGMYLPNSFGFYFCITWLPTYLKENFHFESTRLDFFAGLPLLLSIGADLIGGFATDAIGARFGLRAGRCGVGGLAYVVAGAAMLLVPVVSSPTLAATLIAVAVAASMLALAPAWGVCLDVAGPHAAMVGAMMNTAGQLGSLLCPLIVAYSLAWLGSWNVSIYFMGATFLCGAACWALIQPQRPVFD